MAALGLTLGFLAACTGQVDVGSPADHRSCSVAQRIIAGPSPFEAALGAYDHEGTTSFVLARLDAACLGEPGACFLLSVIYESGDGTKRDPVKAAAYRARGCASREDPMLDLGGCTEAEIFHDQGIQVRVESSRCGLVRACERGCETACDGALVQTRDRIIEPLLHTCERGYGAACHVAARVVERGIVIDGLGSLPGETGEQRAQHTHDLREKACTAGVGTSCLELAEALRASDAESRDRTKKLARACELGVPAACLQQGDRALQGQDPARAAAHYGRACELGMKGACKDLARMYERGALETGRGTFEPWPRDAERAARYRALASPRSGALALE